MKKLFAVLFTLLVCTGSLSAQAPAADPLDNQFWNETQLTFPVIKKEDSKGKSIDKLSLFLIGNIRLGTNNRKHTEQRIGFGLIYRKNKHFSITPGYIYIAQQEISPRRKLYESRFRLAVNVENSWKKYAIDDRNLVEYRLRNGVSDSVRYRNRLRFTHHVRKNDKELFSPFVADEVYYDFEAKSFNRNELMLGIAKKFNDHVSADFFYMWQANRSGLPRNMNVFGVNLKFKID